MQYIENLEWWQSLLLFIAGIVLIGIVGILIGNIICGIIHSVRRSREKERKEREERERRENEEKIQRMNLEIQEIQQLESWTSMKIGDIVYGKVTNILGYGAFVLVDDYDGLVHISEFSDGFVRNINDFVKVGQEIKLTPPVLKPKVFKISLANLTSSIGSSVKETLIVSPIPIDKSAPIPIEDLTIPPLSVPASVKPTCKGYGIS